MKAITILQPWASLIACGAKKIETRSWLTKYRGPIAIHAGKKDPRTWLHPCSDYDFVCVAEKALKGALFYELPRGAVVAIADLVDCIKVVGRVSLKIYDEKRVAAVLENNIKVMGNELEFGDYTNNRYAWILDNVRRIEPVPANGRQRLWEWDEEGVTWANQQTG